MTLFSLTGLWLLSLSLGAAGLHSTAEPLLIVALQGDTVILPCGISSIKSCFSIDWNMGGEFGFITEVVKAGVVTAEIGLRHEMLKDCSLKITQLVLSDARLYSCHSGTLNSSVSLQILELTERPDPAEGTMELQCFLNRYIGYVACEANAGIHIKWSTEDDSPINGDRFSFDNPSDCFSKLIITKNPTDHHRKWKCQLSQNDVPKATISYTTTVRDGLEEVFAAVDEPVSLSCSTSSLGVQSSVNWTVCEKPPTGHTLSTCDQVKAFNVAENPSLVINKLSALHAGDYQCSESTGQQRVLNKIRLHTLDVTAEAGPGGNNLTLTCVLTCATDCEKVFSLSWSNVNQKDQQSPLMSINNTYKKKLFLPAGSQTDEISCSVRREGALMASKKWHHVNPLQTPAWLGLPLCLLICIGAGGLNMYKKKRHKKDAANEPSSIGLTHVYDVIQDVNHEEQQQQREFKREAAKTTDSFYDLLQAVN